MQSNKKSTRGVATREVLRSNDTAKRSAEIVVAARELYEEKGLARTSIQDNHQPCGRDTLAVLPLLPEQGRSDERRARPVHHRFSGGHAALAREPDGAGHRRIAALHGEDHAHGAVREEHLPHRPFSTQENAALYLDFLNRFAAQGAEFMVTHPMVEQTKYGEQSDHLYETFYVLIVGW